MTMALSALIFSLAVHAIEIPRAISHKRTFPREVLTAECRTACMWANYDSGRYSTRKGVKVCLCYDVKLYERMTAKRTTLPKKIGE